ncbi:MAG: hypothetical protein HGA24_11410, partial [Candidatus Aminicenantes bacterium]|nr:hypothetical protein [Candidatus Aminicenantes bacterium]
MKRMLYVGGVLLLAAISCGGQQVPAPQGSAEFDAASAFGFVKKQVEFGPRVPGTPAHAACADWLVKTLKQWTPDVVVQEFKARAYDGRPLEGKNIVASFDEDKTELHNGDVYCEACANEDVVRIDGDNYRRDDVYYWESDGGYHTEAEPEAEPEDDDDTADGCS